MLVPLNDDEFVRPVRDSIQEVGRDSWIIGHQILLSRQTDRPSSGCFWSDGASSFYTISQSAKQPQLENCSAKSPFPLVYDRGDTNAAWRIGDAFLKVQVIRAPNKTREHTTLAYLNDPTNDYVPSFPIPRVLYHAEFGNRYYLVVSRLPGQTLEEAWPSMDEATKQTCVDRVVDICKELAQLKSNQICGVDGAHLSENWMKPPIALDGYSPEELLGYCEEIGMDCTDFVLHHCDMGPTNVIVDYTEGCTVGLIDWEVTGFVPKAWIRTKFLVCWGMDFDFPGEDVEKSKDWRQRVQVQLGQEGFCEVADAWKDRFRRCIGG